ncbi:putative barnase/colicin E5 family endoribonuclease [Campylobacter hyointestinalis]|uniref:putative barnase/colicin E5 family endoribonuclease n=1 Tax=Campylobacter hyointestinalis TaxID=198 RepID=UPI000E155F4F|nr:hypothetical protein [Campylobacter hyointestinalis]SUW89084.1 Uncharacterised protein [Campylobacter hyointestinalis]
MKNISDSNLMNQISRDGKTSIEALNAMLKSSDNINGVNLNDFLGSLGAKDRAVAEANLIRGLMDKNSVNGVVDFRALNQNLASLDFQSEFAKELKSQILSKQSILNNTSDILNSLGSKVIKSKGMSQGISADPLKRADTMRANFIVEKMKPLIPYLGNNEALKLHLNRAILNANGDFKLAIKNIDNIPSGNLPTPTRNLLNEFKIAMKDIEQVVKSQAKKEIRGIHNVTYNDKKATYIKTDLENVDSAIRYANTNRDKGAKHIKIRHLMDETKPGYITNQELLNLGNSLREYIKTYKEPFIDKNGARIYEWENKEGVKFRVVVDSSRRDATTAELPQPTATDDIITFYSDRNIKDKMIFRNPKLNQTIKEAENLAKPQATPKQEPTKIKAENQVNLANQSIKGDGFVTYPNSARQIYPYNAIFEVPNEIKQIVDIGDRVSASLEWLRSNHPEMFKTQRAVKEVIDYVLKEPENIVSPKKGNGVILSKQNDKKMDEIGINQNSEVFHANKRKLNSNEKKAVSRDALPPHLDADNISLTGRYSVGEKSHLTAFDENIIPQNTKTTIKPQDEVVKTEVIKKENGNKGQLAQQNIKQKEAKPNLEEPNVLTKLMKTVEEIYTDDGDFKVKTLKVYGSEKNKDFSVYIDNKKVSIPEEQTTKFHDNGERFAFVRDGEIVDNLSQEAKEALFDNNKISGMDKIQMGIALDKAKVSTLSDKIDALKKAGYSDDNIYEYLLKKDSELIDGIASIKANTKFNSILDSVKGSSSQIQKLRAILDKNIMNTDTLSNIKKPQLLNEVYNLLNGKRLNNELLDKASLIKWNFKGFEHKNALKHNDFFTFTHNMLNLIKSTKGDANQKSTLRKIITAKIKDLDSDEAKNSVIKKISYELYDKELSPELLQKVVQMNTNKEPQAQAIAKDLTADAPSELYKAHRKAQKAKEPQPQLAQTTAKTAEPIAQPKAEINNTQNLQSHPNTNSRYEIVKKFVEGKTNKALDNEINAYNQLYRYVLDDFAKAHPSELNLPQYASEMANYITKEFLVKHDKEIKEIITQKTSGENRQIALEAFENLKQNFDELRSVGIGDLIKPTAKGIKDKIAQVEIKSMSDKELVTQFQKLNDSKARVNENVFSYLQNEIKQREKKLYPFINSDKKDYSYDLEKQLKNRGLMGLKDSDLENIAKERNSILYLPSYVRGNIEKELNITPIKEFGTNYAEFYHDGENAIKKLLVERQGQVAGAFERKELGDIDLVWGEVTDAIKHKGYGLSHILDKRVAEFMEQGLSKEQAGAKAKELIDKLPDIIKNGQIVENAGVNTIILKEGNSEFRAGLSKGFFGKGDNQWIITSYEKKSPNAQNFDQVTNSKELGNGNNLSLKGKNNSTPKEIKSQDLSVEQKAKQYAKFLSEAKEPTQDAPDELYKAYNKAKKDLNKPKNK